MASHYLREVRELQPEGPYYLGGFCMGGSVAFEMAQQLTRDGQPVALLALFDSYNHNGTRPRQSPAVRVSYLAQKIEFHLKNLAQIDPKHRWLYLTDKLKGVRARETERISVALSNILRALHLGNGKNKVDVFLEPVNEQAGIAYKPRVYRGKLTLFQPSKNYSFRTRQHMSWQAVAAEGLRLVELPVHPGGMFAEPYVRTLAARLKDCLDEASAEMVATSRLSRAPEE